MMFFTVISPATVTCDSHYLLALATLADTAKIGSFLFNVTLPKAAKASTSVALSPVIVAGIIALASPM